jgi:predicted nucleic acid-binding protein
MLTTWPVVTEAMHLLRKRKGWPGQDSLWRAIAAGTLGIADIDEQLRERSRQLMAKYKGSPMDIADATLVAVAERHGLRQIFTLDSHFAVYRINGRDPFEIVP